MPATFCMSWQKGHEKCNDLPFCQYFDYFVPAQMKWAKPNIVQAANKMYLAYVMRERPVTLPRDYFSLERVGREMAADIAATRHRKRPIHRPTVSENDWTVQKDMNLFGKFAKQKLIVLNAAGNGNVGDDAYNEVLAANFDRKNIDVYFCKDNCKLLEDGSIIPLFNTTNGKNLLKFNHIMVLGGGLLTKERLKCFKWYVDQCREFDANFFICSVGFQGGNIRPNSKGDVILPDWIHGYAEIFKYAQFISLRSFRDLEIVRQVMGQSDIVKTDCNPDLAYAYKAKNKLIRNGGNAYYSKINSIAMIVMTRDVSIETHPEFYQKVEDIYKEGKHQIVFANFGGFSDDSNTHMEEVFSRALASFPKAKILHGKFPTSYSKQTWDYQKTNEDYTQSQLDSILSRTKIMISSRLHGLILAKAFMVPEIITFNGGNYKIEQELKNHLDLPSQILSIRALRPIKFIENLILDHGVLDYKDWSENTRNQTIVRLSKEKGMPIKTLQAMNNYELNILKNK